MLLMDCSIIFLIVLTIHVPGIYMFCLYVIFQFFFCIIWVFPLLLEFPPFYMYLSWCHIILPPPTIISPYLYCCHILHVLFFTPFLSYYVTLYSPTDISPLPYNVADDSTGQMIVDIVLVYSFWCPSMSYSICPQLFSPYL